METRKRVLGADHPSTLISINNLAATYGNLGRWDEAEELEVQVIQTSKRVLGQDHPDTTASMANLALTYSLQGKHEEARKVHSEEQTGRENKLRSDLPATI
jgi:Flp pilus assembly protein TadD